MFLIPSCSVESIFAPTMRHVKTHLLCAEVFLLCFLWMGCRRKNTPVNKTIIQQAIQRNHNPDNARLADSLCRFLKSGDIIVRTGDDITSYMLCQFNQTDKTYSHCGLVMVENGYPFVYHSIGGEDNPDERLRRDSASFFVTPKHNLGAAVYRYPLSDSQIIHWHRVAKEYYKKRPLFDLKFDLATEDALYCSEFIYKSLSEAIRDSTYIQPVTVLGYRFIGIDNLFLNKHAQIICRIKYKSDYTPKKQHTQ